MHRVQTLSLGRCLRRVPNSCRRRAIHSKGSMAAHPCCPASPPGQAWIRSAMLPSAICHPPRHSSHLTFSLLTTPSSSTRDSPSRAHDNGPSAAPHQHTPGKRKHCVCLTRRHPLPFPFHPPAGSPSTLPLPPPHRQALWSRIWDTEPCFAGEPIRPHPDRKSAAQTHARLPARPPALPGHSGPAAAQAYPLDPHPRSVVSTAPVLKFATPLRFCARSPGPDSDHVCARLQPWPACRRGGPFLTVRTSIPIRPSSRRPFHSHYRRDIFLSRRHQPHCHIQHFSTDHIVPLSANASQ